MATTTAEQITEEQKHTTIAKKSKMSTPSWTTSETAATETSEEPSTNLGEFTTIMSGTTSFEFTTDINMFTNINLNNNVICRDKSKTLMYVIIIIVNVCFVCRDKATTTDLLKDLCVLADHLTNYKEDKTCEAFVAMFYSKYYQKLVKASRPTLHRTRSISKNELKTEIMQTFGKG